MSCTGTAISSPLGSVDILDHYQTVLQRRFNPTATHLTHSGRAIDTQCDIRLTVYTGDCTDVLEAYEWLLCYLLVESQQRVEQEMMKKKVSGDHHKWL